VQGARRRATIWREEATTMANLTAKLMGYDGTHGVACEASTSPALS
jgi:hypothetical protein